MTHALRLYLPVFALLPGYGTVSYMSDGSSNNTKVPVTPQLEAECICQMCPSYPGNNDPKQYCGSGKSDQKISMEGCLCPSGCPVYSQYKLKDMYFCVYGKAK